MKKLSVILMVICMVGGLIGCGNQKEEEQESKQVTLSTFAGKEAMDSSLYVDKVDGIDDSFIRGVDISSYISLIESGATFKDWEGNIIDDAGFFNLLGDAGVNWIRIRVWNDPTDSSGNSYGGGHNDLETAIKIGKLATQAGMQVLVDYHYSDFWADPSKQKAPKEWSHYTYEDKKAAFAEFTKDSLIKMLDEGINVGMVQVGNETVSGLCGETSWDRMCELMNLGCGAVREVAAEKDKEIMIAIHFTNPDSKQFLDYAANLAQYNVDYDVFASSYYSFWHGTTEKLTSQLSTIAKTYNKKVMVAETSYVYTNEDGDGWPNSVSEGDDTISIKYDISIQGQANAVRDVMQAVADVDGEGLGVFYWEPAWIPVEVYDYTAGNASSVLASNKEKWETFGSGWASSFASKYDANDAGKYFGGSSWDNQAMFDFYGNPLESLNVYKYIYTGTTAPLTVIGVEDVYMEVGIGESLQIPETVPATLCNGKTKEVPVKWDLDAIKAAETKGGGSYQIKGIADADGTTYDLIGNLEILKINYVKNPGFEDKDLSMWNFNGKAADREADNNKRSGEYSLKFWSTEAFSYTVEQTIENLSEATYEAGVFLQGGDAGANAIFQFYVKVNDETYTVDTGVTGWLKWAEPHIDGIVVPEGATVTIGVKVESTPKTWGAWDDFYLFKVEE